MRATEAAQVGADLAGQIRSAIVRGEFSPNERLVESDPVERFGSSRSAVRAALIALSNEGLVEREQNRGARVRTLTHEQGIELCEVRRVVESLCAAKAAERITDAESEELFEIVAAMELMVSSGDVLGYSESDERLHRRIAEMSGHTIACAIVRQMRDIGSRLQLRLFLMPGRPFAAMPEHKALVEAIVGRDPDRADAAMWRHLTSVIELLRAVEPTEIR